MTNNMGINNRANKYLNEKQRTETSKLSLKIYNRQENGQLEDEKESKDEALGFMRTI